MAKTILVVDDDADTLTLIGLTLQRRGFEVVKAQSGQQAISLLAHDRPDLVILDVMMPQMDGYEVCREIKADPRTADLPVIMLTAKAQTQSQLEGFRSGAIDYITKPVHPQDLVARIQTVLERAQSAQVEGGAQVVAVSGARGGVGASTLAVNVAAALAANHRTILVDLELSGTAAIQLGLMPVRSLADLIGFETEPIEATSVEAALTSHASGLRLLAAADSPIDPARAQVILNHLHTLCDICIVDLGWGMGPIVRAIAPRANHLLLATDADRASVTQASRLLHLLKESGTPAEAIQLIWINRHGTANETGLAALQAGLGRAPAASIGAAAEAMFAAVEAGQPLVMARPADAVAVQLSTLAASLLPAA
jgi:DNA-binding response OmpR family regulator